MPPASVLTGLDVEYCCWCVCWAKPPPSGDCELMVSSWTWSLAHLGCPVPALPICLGVRNIRVSCCARGCKGKEKERRSIYIAPFCTKVHTKCSGMDHTVLPANNTMPAFPSWAFTRWHHHNNWGSRHPIAAYYSFIDPKRIQLQLTSHLLTPKGWKAELAWLVDL